MTPTAHHPCRLAILIAMSVPALPALAQTLQPVTVTATRTEAAPFDVPASVDAVRVAAAWQSAQQPARGSGEDDELAVDDDARTGGTGR